MLKEEFYQYLCEELHQNSSLYPYYKLINGSVAQKQFRKAYFLQRLGYLDQYIDLSKNPTIWDCGCGYGTSCLYLAMNGQSTYGTTLEFYADQINHRKDFWNQYGNAQLFNYEYANIFDQQIPDEHFDYIILQDTLHHIEPMQDALLLLYKALKKGGKLILIEENGGCLIKRALLFLKRGNKRVISVHDDILKKDILMGNENIRSEKAWRKVFSQTPFVLDPNSVQYIRRYLPLKYKRNNLLDIISLEQRQAKNKIRCHYQYFGLNMVFVKE